MHLSLSRYFLRTGVPQSRAPQVAPSSPADDALVRVWPSSRQLGPSPRRVFSGRNLGPQGVSFGNSSRPHFAEKRAGGSGRTFLSVTWTWVSLACWTAGGWRSLSTGSRFNGSQLAIDTTLVRPIHRDRTPRPRTHEVHGVALQHARRNKEATYPELIGRGGKARSVVLAGEVGGRFSAETAQFISSLAWAKTRGMSNLLRRRATCAWTRGRSALLSCAAGRAFASSLLDSKASAGVDGAIPNVQEMLIVVRSDRLLTDFHFGFRRKKGASRAFFFFCAGIN